MATAASILGLTLDPLGKYTTNNSILGLLVGPPRAGKTSLAFGAARSLVARNLAPSPGAEVPPRSVWFACRRAKIEACLPAPVEVRLTADTSTAAPLVSQPSGPYATATMPSVDDADLEHVAMKYFTSIGDLKSWCLRVHELGTATASSSSGGGGGMASYPAAMVLDDLDLLLDAEVGRGAEPSLITLCTLKSNNFMRSLFCFGPASLLGEIFFLRPPRSLIIRTSSQPFNSSDSNKILHRFSFHRCSLRLSLCSAPSYMPLRC
jgi:hypothetical protein